MNSDGYLFTKCCPGDSYSARNVAKGSKTSHGQKKKRGKGILKCSNLLKTVYNKFVLINNVNSRAKNEQSGCSSKIISANRDNQEIAESDRISFASSTTVSNLCTLSDTEESWKYSILSASDSLNTINHSNSNEHETIREEEKPCKNMQDDYDKQFSPVSALEEMFSHEESSLYKTQQDYIARQEGHPSISGVFGGHEIVKEYMLSSYLLELLSQSFRAKKASQDNVECLHQHFGSIRILQETKQLLFDCVGEVLEAQRKKKNIQELFLCREFLGSEEIGKLICEKLIAWDEQSVDETVLNSVFDSAVKWNDFETEEKEIAFDIGDCILKYIINEIVLDLLLL